MKKVITIVCLAAAPIIFAQEKASKVAQSVKSEQVEKKKAHAEKLEANKKIEADKAKKKAEIKANQNINTSSTKQSATLEANPVRSQKK